MDLGPEKYSHSLFRAACHTQVARISEQGNKFTRKLPVKKKPRGDKNSTVYELSECCKLKGETQQEAFISRMAVQQALKEKYPFSELTEEWKFASWI